MANTAVDIWEGTQKENKKRLCSINYLGHFTITSMER